MNELVNACEHIYDVETVCYSVLNSNCTLLLHEAVSVIVEQVCQRARCTAL